MKFNIISSCQSILDKMAALQDMNTSLEAQSLVDMGSGIDSSIAQDHSLVTDFLEEGMDSPKDWAMKKIMSSAITIAKSKGVEMPFELKDSSPMGIASLVDEGFTKMKVFYQVATGKMSIKKALNHLYDHAAARLASVAGRITEKYLPDITEQIFLSIGVIYPPAITAAPFVRAFTEKYAPLAGRYVEIGVRNMASSVKERVVSAAHSVATKAVSIGRSAISTVKGWFK